jgi:hypothetical protein
MQLWRKFLYYFIGMGLGVLMVYFIFGDRDIQCSYFPNDRVLSDLRKKDLTLSVDVQHKIDRSELDTSGLSYALDYAKVNFSASTIIENDCNVYQLELEREDNSKIFAIENCDSSATLLRVVEL